MQNEIKTLINELFQKLNIKINSIDIGLVKGNANFKVKIKTDESKILIGKDGNTLDSLQNIIRLMCSNKIGEKVKILLEINGYSKTKDDKLFDFIRDKIKEVEKNKKDIALPYYGPHERKKIHGYVNWMKEKGISTKSIGEGKERRIYICKKAEKLSIDIDGNDI